MMSAQKFRGMVLAGGAVLAIAVGGWLLSRLWSEKPHEVVKQPAADPRLPNTPVSRPTPPPEGYVGSAACAKCHEDLCKSFAQHPMGRSSALTPGPADLEDYALEKASFASADGTRYKAEKAGDVVLHHEIGVDPQGRVLYDRSVPVSLALGSGTRGKTYATNRDGILLQSPISWYSPKGGYFELSPGYEFGPTNPRFGRRITKACLVCHVGRMEFDPDVMDKLNPPYFHEITIGCERCHGPGSKHVATQEAGKTLSPDASIINPARLSARERASVCYQCHLHGAYRTTRYARQPQDFRPGMAIEEIFCVMVKDSPVGDDKSVSQVEQMRASACYKGSPEKLGCISCHNPHEWPAPEKREAYYRSRCNKCHADVGKDCSLPINQREQKSDSCIACHMPRTTPKDVVHASQTDHRVLRAPQLSAETDSQPAEGAPNQELKFFDDADQRLPYWEVLRTRGLMLASGKGTANPDEDAVSLLRPLAIVAPDDVMLLNALGASSMSRKDFAGAKKWLEQAAAIEPKNEHVQLSLALVCVATKDFPGAIEHIGIVVSVNPHVARNFVLQAQILAEAGEPQQALRAAEKAMELDPTQSGLRDQLQRTRRN